MTRAGKVAKAKELRAKDWKTADIAAQLGLPDSTVAGWLRDEPWPTRQCSVCGSQFVPSNGNQRTCCGENARKRHWERQNRASCVDCGAPLGAGSAAPSRSAQRCRSCFGDYCVEQTAARRDQIESLWAEGLLLREIADRLGTTKGAISVEIVSMRREGRSVPYRYAGEHRFSGQVAA